MRRRRVEDRVVDRRVFSHTADDVHWVNFGFLYPMRGGRRL